MDSLRIHDHRPNVYAQRVFGLDKSFTNLENKAELLHASQTHLAESQARLFDQMRTDIYVARGLLADVISSAASLQLAVEDTSSKIADIAALGGFTNTFLRWGWLSLLLFILHQFNPVYARYAIAAIGTQPLAQPSIFLLKSLANISRSFLSPRRIWNALAVHQCAGGHCAHPLRVRLSNPFTNFRQNHLLSHDPLPRRNLVSSIFSFPGLLHSSVERCFGPASETDLSAGQALYLSRLKFLKEPFTTRSNANSIRDPDLLVGWDGVFPNGMQEQLRSDYYRHFSLAFTPT